MQEYWQTLVMYDLLKDRLHDTKDPQWLDVVEVIQRMGSTMYHVLNEAGQLIMDMALEPLKGRTALIHWSVRPELPYSRILTVAREVTDFVLGTTELAALVGATPITFKGAVITAYKTGFKKQCVLPQGAYLASEDKYVDAVITMKTKEDV